MDTDEDKTDPASRFPTVIKAVFSRWERWTLSVGGEWGMWSQWLMVGVSPAEQVQINQTLKVSLNT